MGGLRGDTRTPATEGAAPPGTPKLDGLRGGEAAQGWQQHPTSLPVPCLG